MKNIQWFKIVALMVVFCMLLGITGGNAAAKNSMMPPGGVKLQDDPPPADQPVDDMAARSTNVVENVPGWMDEDGLFGGDAIAASTNYTVTVGAWRNIRPTESFLRGVSLLPASYNVNCYDIDQKSKGWIVGDNGVILNYCNGYWDHAIVVESVPTTLFSVQAISPTLGVTVGEEGAILHYLYDSTAKAYVWTKAPINVGNHVLYGVSMAKEGRDYVGWAVGNKDTNGRGTLVRGRISPGALVDGERTYQYSWINETQLYSSLPAVDFYFDVQMLSPTEGWATGGSDEKTDTKGVILKFSGATFNNGTWSVFQTTPEPLRGVHMVSSTEGYAVGRNGTVYYFDGRSWVKMSTPTTPDVIRDVSKDPVTGQLWAVGINGTILNFKDGQWSLFTERRTDVLDYWTLDFTSGHGWLVGYNPRKGIGGHILEYDEGLWLAVTPPTDNRLNAVAIISETDAWAVGHADDTGGTIIHWDGKHWQRWFQKELPIPPVDLYAVDFFNSKDGWAAGDTYGPSEPAIFLHWDGHRWAPSRDKAPVNVRVNDMDLLYDKDNKPFGWTAQNNGNAFAKYQQDPNNPRGEGFWSGLHSCGGLYYEVRDVDVVKSKFETTFGWRGYGAGRRDPDEKGPEVFLQYTSGCSEGYAWTEMQYPVACPNDNGFVPLDGKWETRLQASAIEENDEGVWGYSVGYYKDRFSVYRLESDGSWVTYICQAQASEWKPGGLYAADVPPGSEVVWMGGYNTDPVYKLKRGIIRYIDVTGFKLGGVIFPLNGRNFYHRPIRDLKMSSDTMGWAVGDNQDPAEKSVIYQYPFPNFTLDSAPKSLALRPGESDSYTVKVNSLGGFSANVNLEVVSSALPAGITAYVTPAVINAVSTASVNVSVASSTAQGIYTIPLRAASIFRSGDSEIPVTRYFNLMLTVTDHPVVSIYPDKGPAGTIVTISGRGFGSSAGSDTDDTFVVIADASLSDDNIVSWTDTQIKVRIPDSTLFFPHGPQEGAVKVVKGGAFSNDELVFQVESQITAYEEKSRVNGVVTLRIVGTGFGIDPGQFYRSTYLEHITLSGMQITDANVISWNNNEIVFKVDESQAAGTLTVTSNGFESNSIIVLGGGEDQSFVYVPLLRKR